MKFRDFIDEGVSMSQRRRFAIQSVGRTKYDKMDDDQLRREYVKAFGKLPQNYDMKYVKDALKNKL